MFGKSSFHDLEPSTMIHADSVSFLTSEDRIQKHSSMFGFPWTNPKSHKPVNNSYSPKNGILDLLMTFSF